MAQTWTDDTFAAGHVAQTDLQNMENNFTTLKSLFSGAAAPANQVAGMPWFDTTQDVLKYRNSGDSAWLGLMHGDISQKMWVYRNAAMDGWAVDSAVSDRVLALKGGTTYTTGAAGAGSWTVSGLSASSHTHDDGTLAAPNHTHTLAGSGSGGAADYSVTISGGYLYAGSGSGGAPSATSTTGNPSATAVSGDTGSTAPTMSSDASWRPAASVGTLQYLDL